MHTRRRRTQNRAAGVAVGLSLAAAVLVPASARAQGAEPRLLIPPPAGTTTAPQPAAPGVLPSTGSTAPAVPSTAPAGAATGSAATPPSVPATARLEVRMTQLEQDLRTVTGRLEDVTYQLRKLDDRLNKLSADVDYRLGQGRSSGDASPMDSRADAGAAAPSAPPATSSGIAAAPSRPSQPPATAPAAQQSASLAARSPREQYANAFSLLEKHSYVDAASAFNDFLTANPDDPLADNARYWLGESYYARGEYARAAEIFLDGYEKNKTGPKAPDTLLKLGLSLSGLGKNREACASFKELDRAFPSAPAAVKDRAAQETKRLSCS